MLKICDVCGKEFNAIRSQKRCSKDCSHKQHLDYDKNFQQTHKEWYRTYKKDWIKRTHYSLRKKLKEIKLSYCSALGNKCFNHVQNFNCSLEVSEYNLSMFDFHHLEPPSTPSNKRRGLENPDSKNFDISKVILLCSNCHRLEHYQSK